MLLRLIKLIKGLDLLKQNYDRKELQQDYLPYNEQPDGYGVMINAMQFVKGEGIDCFNDFEGLLSLTIKMKTKFNYQIMHWYDSYINSTPATEELLKKWRDNYGKSDLEYDNTESDFFKELNIKNIWQKTVKTVKTV